MPCLKACKNFSFGSKSMKKASTLLVFLSFLMLQAAYSQDGGFGKERRGRANPFRVYYFGYDLQNPGIYLGPELNFLWTKHEKVQCETGLKVVEKKLLFVPHFGAVFFQNTRLNVFAGLEIDYHVTYHKGGIFEIFSSLAYAQRFGNGVDPMSESALDDVLMASRGYLMPGFGIGTGYDFHKMDSKIPLMLNFRVLSSSLQPSESFFNPGFQVGFTYGFH
jgi:hypothetical protein